MVSTRALHVSWSSVLMPNPFDTYMLHMLIADLVDLLDKIQSSWGDACAVVPIFGYRYACKSCSSHDVCESCFDAWAGGTGRKGCGFDSHKLGHKVMWYIISYTESKYSKTSTGPWTTFQYLSTNAGVMPNKLAKQTLSTNPTDHSFKLYKECKVSGCCNISHAFRSYRLFREAWSVLQQDQTFKPVVKPAGGASTKSAPKLKPNDNCFLADTVHCFSLILRRVNFLHVRCLSGKIRASE